MRPAVAVRLVELGQLESCDPADSDLDIVFSTGCNAFQNWQAEVLLNSAYHAGQCGRLTRVVVGCDAAESDAAEPGTRRVRTHPGGSADRKVELSDLELSTNPRFRIHVAPSIPEAKEFPWFNKPWSFYHWLKNAPSLNRAVAIIDPDEFFLQPLTQRGGALVNEPGKYNVTATALVQSDRRSNASLSDVARPGMAVAQKYGTGLEFKKRLDQRSICPGGEQSPCAVVQDSDGLEYYQVGPPYILHRDDFAKVVPTWWELMGPVYEHDRGDIQADMYAYIYAAAHQGVRHATFDNFMVSNVKVGRGEAWRFVDDVEQMSCHDPQFLPGQPRPGFLHAAQMFKACTKGDLDEKDDSAVTCPSEGSELWLFHKGHVPGEILSCEHPLLMPPPDDLINAQAHAGTKRGKRAAFALCTAHFLINRAALEYKRKFCQSTFNSKKCTRLIAGERRNNLTFRATNPWRYPLARVDADCCPECQAQR